MIVRKYCRLFLICFILTACSPIVDADRVNHVSDDDFVIVPDSSIGQTFVARHGGLRGVEIWLTPLKQDVSGDIIVQLKKHAASSETIHYSSLSLHNVTVPAYYRFNFPTIKDSHSTYYYASIRYTGEVNSISTRTGQANTYRDGALHEENVPVEGQLSFRLVYDPLYLLFDLIQAATLALRWLCYAILLFVIPGLALLLCFWPRKFFTYGEAIGLAIGISFSIYPLLFLLTSWVGMSLGVAYAWIPVILGLLALVWRYYRSDLPRDLSVFEKVLTSSGFQANLVYTIIIGLLCISRLLPIRGISIPMWGDSVQHATITQLFLDNSGLFDTWMPYAPYKGLSIHYGFHTLSAVFAWFSNLGAPKSTLVTGQLVNVGAILALYPLALKLSLGQRWAGLVTVLTAGFIFQTPAFFVNWGRYPQLAGLAILPVSIWLVCEMLEGKQFLTYGLVLTSAVIAGMTLTYYRMPYFFAIYMLVWVITWVLTRYLNNWRSLLKMSAKLIIIAAFSVLFFSPWLMRIKGATLITVMGSSSPTLSLLGSVLDDYQVWCDITKYVPVFLMILFGLGFIISTIRKTWHTVGLGFWVVGLALLVAGRLIGLPGANMIKNFGIIISLYIPVSLMIGWLCVELHKYLTKYVTLHKWLYILPYLGLVLWGLGKQLRIIDTSYMMVNRPDVRAFEWVRDNTPADARFLVEGFQVYDGFSAVGTDAGWWIPLLARRENTMPPQYAMINEESIDPHFTHNIVKLVSILEEHQLTSSEALHALCDHGVTHIYIGQGQGLVGISVPQLYSDQEISGNPTFIQIYKQDLVRIYKLAPGICDS